jgi:serine/threonine protein kinase
MLGQRYRIDELAGVGRHGLLFSATDLVRQTPVAIKQPAFDYARPLSLDRRSVRRSRLALAREHRVLTSCAPSAFPAPHALLEAPHVVPAARTCAALGDGETYLVEELIDGVRLTTLALGSWRRDDPITRERRAARVASTFLDSWNRAHRAGWHYADISADNILIERASGTVRIVDAGGCLRAAGEVRLGCYSPAFMTPRLLERAEAGLPVPGSLAAVLPPLAKVLHFALTRREPLSGALPDAQDRALGACSPLCRRALAAMLAVDAHPDPRAALTSLEAWTEQVG